MSNQKPFTDPTIALAEKDRLRTSITYSRPVVAALSRVHCRKGTEQITTNILLAKLQTALIEAGLTEYDPDAYEQFVINCRLLAPKRGRSASTLPPSGSESVVTK